MSATISLVIITYNRDRYLRAAIESVLAQTKHDFELLIWDDGSTDNSVEIAQNYAKNDRRVRVITAKHQGETLSRKAAISQTTGEYLGWVDSDDLLAPTALAETASILDIYPEVGLVYTDYLDISASGEIIGYGERCKIPYSPEGLLLDFMTFHFRLFRRAVFEQVGGIDESVKYAPDYDLCLKFSEVTQIRHINKPLYYYRNHSESITQQQQLEVIQYSQKVINQALERRGLSDRFSLTVQLQEINGQIQSKFYLINKQNLEKPSLKTQKKHKIFACTFFISSLALFNINPAFAQPIVPAKDGTNTIVNPQGNRFDITGGQRSRDGANLFHSFTRFGLDNQQIANFLSQPNIRNILARINGGEISYINGLIQITGGNSNLFLMNPSGIVFGGNARLNVPAAFTATTANGIGFGNNWFNATGNNNYTALVGNPNAFAFTMQQPGTIINSGDLAVGLGQDLNLLAGTVINTGTLTAPQGNITVAAVPGTSLVRLSQPGFLLSLEVQPIGNSATQPNDFNLPIASLPQMLTGGTGGNATGVTVNKDGSVELTGSGIRIPTEGNTAIVSGKIEASGETGGNINILGDKIGVINANVNASGTKDGGNIHIGGDYKGQGKLPNASRVLISNDTIIKADSFTAGNGGKVIIWSDEATTFNGKISAKGGSNSGDGGFVEVSSADILNFNGDVDTSAPNGKTGTLLLDPSFLIISDTLGGTTLGGGVGDQDSNLISDNQILAGDPDQPKNTVTWKAINSLGSSANVILEASGDITIDDIPSINDNLVGLNLDKGSLRITSTNGSVKFIDVFDEIRTQGGAITVQALGGKLITGSFNTTGTFGDKSGNVNLEAKAELEINGVTTGGGDISITSGGPMTFNGIIDSSSSTKNGGNITIKSGDEINARILDSSSANGKGGNINVTASKNILLSTLANSSGTNGGGDISIISTGGAIGGVGGGYGNVLGNIIATGGSGVGGKVSLKALTRIDITAIDTTGNAGKGDIILIGNEIDFNSSIAGGVVTLEPSSTTEAIRIAGDTLDNTDVLDISPNDRNQLTNITQLIIGSTQGTGNITVDSTGATFNSPLTIQSSTGNITANGNLDVPIDDTITLTTGGNITTKNVTATGGINITSTGGNIDTSNGQLNTSSISKVGSILLKATGNITTSDIIAINSSSGDGGNVSLISSGGTINTTAGKIDTNSNANTGGSVLLNSPINIIPGNISTKGSIAGGNVDFNGKVTLNKDASVSTGASVSGDINFTGKVDGTQKLTLEAGTGTIRFNAVIGETIPLGKLDITSAGNIELAGNITTNNSDINFNAPVTVLGNSILNAGTATINVNQQLVAGNNQLTFTANAINFKGGTASVSGTNKLILQPATPSLDINIGGTSEQEIISNLTLTTFDINALKDGFSSLVIGRENSSGTISVIGNVTFNDPLILQSPVGTGNIKTTGFNITGKDDATVTLLANLDINTGNITAPKGITITSNNGVINTTSGTLNSSAISDRDAGDITLKAAGDITTSNLTAQGNAKGGNGGKVSITSTGGSVDTSADIDTRAGISSSGITGNGGPITINAKGDIISSSILSHIGEGSIGNAGSISLTSATGKIDTSKGRIDAGTTFGNAGEITFNALGDITTREVLAYVVNSGKGDGAKITFSSTTGGINTSAGDVDSSSDNGNGGAVNFTAKGDIVTANIDSASRSNGSGGIISLVSQNGIINTATGVVNSSSAADNGGAVTFNAKGNITTKDIISKTGGVGKGGDISVISSAGLIDTSTGVLDTSSVNGIAGNVSLSAPNGITVGTINANGLPQTGNISLTSDKISFAGKTNSIQGKGNLLLQPFTPSKNLDISAVNFDVFAEGFAAITIGAENGSGVVSIPSAIAFSDPVIIQSPNGQIIVNGAITGTDNASITLSGKTNLNGNITTAEQDINLKGSVSLGKNVTLSTGVTAGGNISVDGTIDGNQKLTLETGTGDINLSGAVGSLTPLNDFVINSAKNITAKSISAASITQKAGTGVTKLGDLNTNSASGINLIGNSFGFNGKVTTTNNGGFTISNVSPLTLDAAIFSLDGAFKQVGEGAVSLAGKLTTTSDEISFKSAVTLLGDTVLDTGAGIGDISFNNSLDGKANLTLNAGTGNVNFAGAVGSNTRLSDLIISSATDVNAKSISAASITQKAGTGVTTLGDLNTNSATGINLIGNSFGFNGKVITTNNGGFTISNASPLTLDAAIFSLDGAFKQIGEGAVSLAGKLTTTSDEISFKSAVTLLGDTVLDTGAGIGDISFNNSLDGKANLTLNAGTGNVNFAGAVGSNTRLGDLIISSATDVNANTIKAASITQKSGIGTTNLGILDTNNPQGINLTGKAFNLNGIVTATNNGGFTINNSGALNLKSDVNLDGAFNQIGTGEVFTSGNITTTNNDIRFNSFINLTGETKFNPGTGTIAFNSGLFAGTNSLNLRAGEIVFSGKVTGSGNLILEPAEANQTVAIADSIPGAFNLSANTLANLENGFSSIVIGRTDGTGLVSVKEVTFNDPITIRSGSGTINVNGAIIAKDNASITLDSALINLNANLTTENQNITLGRAIQLGNDITVSTGLGGSDLTFNGSLDGAKQLNLVAGSGNIRFNAGVGKNSPLSKLDISSAGNLFVSQGINTASDLSINVPVILTDNAVFNSGNGSITFGNTVDSEAGKANNLTLSAATGNVTFNGAVGSSKEIGNILITNARDLTANSTIKAQQIQYNAGTGNVNFKGNITTSGAGVELNTTGDIRTSNITAKGGNITANSQNGIVETGNLDVSNTGTGGTITLTAPKAITTGNLTATGVEKGGTVIVKSGDRITTANIDVSATIGDGGTVTLDPPNDVQVGFINAQGGSQGTGGKVDITTESFFRSTATFIDNKGVNSSISTAGGTGNGSIIIRHGGGSLKTPFIVGNANKNGTAGALTTGTDTITPTQSFPGSYTLGNIQIITQDFPSNPDNPGNPDNPDNPITNEITQVIQQQENISELPRIPVTQVPPVPIDPILGVAEDKFSQEFTTYFGLPVTNNIKTLEEIRDRLRRNEAETGVRSAIFYIIFNRGEQAGETLVTCPPSRTENNESTAENCQEKDSDRVELYLITPEGEPVRFPISNVTKGQIIALARQLQMEVTDRTKLNTDSYLAPAQELYKILIAPVEGKLQERRIKNLIFIPDAGLRSLPLAVLHDGKGFILDRYSISLMPSFSLTNPQFYNLKNSTVLAMGASTFKEQAPLPAVPVELSTIANQLWSGEISLNEAFTVNNLNTQRNTGKFEIVHLATHAEFRPGNPSNSYIQFWDEKLGLDRVRTVKWNDPPVQLLVLSACRTALGDKQVELGFAGLAIQAGVQSALASLWYVSDQGTLALMSEFYEQLKTAPIRAEALRLAQLAMIKGEVVVDNNELEGIGKAGISLPPELRQPGKLNFSHPYFWSGFTLIGNPW
ncbi:CHAT domain-containing protein [Floridanema evergladense]|uniref:CHAT domain-containing protein n=1 Tax=Floridaenema evergladense BLCC-F167 TaxID=3153639 RepID=A0ABV4WHE5_9CYAN